MDVQLVDPSAAGWAATLDAIGARLRQPEDPTLFPYHFLHVTLGRIGGAGLLTYAGQTPIGAGFLFPRQRDRGGAHVYTLRYHPYPGAPPIDRHELRQATSAQLGGCDVIFNDPYAPHYYAATHRRIGPVDIGQPDPAEAVQVPSLHQRIWGSPPEYLYPADLFGVDFAAGTRLIARVDDDNGQALAGFLIGFYKFGGSRLPADWYDRFGGDLRLESQIVGVLPVYRGLRIASLLKFVQGEQAWREGVGIVNWTSDPLQYPNAALNFGLLRAVAFDFMPDLYPFRNNLNRVSTSRFALTWLVGSRRVREQSDPAARAVVAELGQNPQIARVNDRWHHFDLDASAPMIAIEVPANWTELQEVDVAEAIRWREATDTIFAHYVGLDEGRYTITGVGVDGEKRYLVAEQSGESLWRRLGAT